jgi:CelD/BcsL family acetyltransferase involved in cellulose biosynthesis
LFSYLASEITELLASLASVLKNLSTPLHIYKKKQVTGIKRKEKKNKRQNMKENDKKLRHSFNAKYS